ncbi:MAG: porin family protein [Bacteroidota bacterium]
MHTTHIWYKFDLHWRKIAKLILITSLFLVSVSALGQRRVLVNNPDYDDRFLSYGFLIGIHTSGYQIKFSEAFVTPDLDTVQSIQPMQRAGFALGFIANFRMAEYLDLRVTPQVAFYEYTLDYNLINSPVTPISQLVDQTTVEFPILAKYKSVRRGNVGMYFVGGVKPGFEASGKNDIVDEDPDNSIQIIKGNFSIDFGVGFDLYFPLFKFSPEIRFSKGMRNVLAPQANDFSVGIDRLNTNTFTLYLLFQ